MAERDAVGAWLEAAGRVPMLTHPEELEMGRLIRVWQDWPDGPDAAPAAVRRRGLRARDRMVRGNLRLVVAVVKRYANVAARRGVPLVDLLQEGAIGLQRGAEKFDPATGYKFSTYAFWWIRQATGRMLGHNGATVRVPAQVGSAMTRLKAGALQWEEMEPWLRKSVKVALRLQRVLSIDAQVGEDGSTLVDLVAA